MGGSREKTRALDTLIKLLQRGVVTGGDVDEAMSYLLKVIGGDAVAAGQGFRFGPWSVLEGLPDSWLAAHARYVHQDQVIVRLRESAPGSWFFIADCSREEKETDLHHRFQDHFGDGAIVRIYSPFVSDLNLVLYASRKRHFQEPERVLLQALYPHLALGLATQRALAALNASEAETLDDVLRMIAGHATISFPTRTVTWSARAKQLWRTRLDIGGNGWTRLDRMLLLACARFEEGSIHARSQVLVPGVRIDFANIPPSAKETRRVLCLLIADERLQPESLSPAEALLTERQRAVARLLVGGSTLPEVARELRISLETAREYCSEIYTRLGVRSRLQLSQTLR